MIADKKRIIANHIEKLKNLPETKLTKLNRYVNYFDNSELEKNQEFLNDENSSFDDYQKKIQQYHEFAVKIGMDNESIIYTPFFEIHQKEFLTIITDNVVFLKNSLLDKLVTDYQDKALR